MRSENGTRGHFGKRYFEFGILHTECGELVLYVALQPFGSASAQLGSVARQRVKLVERSFRPFAQQIVFVVAVGQRGKLFVHFRQLVRQFRQFAVFLFQRAQLLQPRFRFFEIALVEIHVFEQTGNGGRDIVEFYRKRIEALFEFAVFGGERRNRRQRAHGIVYFIRAAVFSGHGLRGGRKRRLYFFAVNGAAAEIDELFLFAFAYRRALDFVYLISKNIYALHSLRRIAYRGDAFFQIRIFAVLYGQHFQHFGQLHAGVRVEYDAVLAFVRKQLVFVLSADIDKMRRYGAEHFHGYAFTVDAYVVSAVGVEFATYYKLAVAFDAEFVQKRSVVFARQNENAFDFAGIGAVAEHRSVVLAAHEQHERVHYNGFAGAGLAAQNIELIREFQLGARNKRQIFDSYPLQHFSEHLPEQIGDFFGRF